MNHLFNKHAPDFAYLGLLVTYFAACFYFDDFGIVVGFALGVASQMCLDWKHERAVRANMTYLLRGQSGFTGQGVTSEAAAGTSASSEPDEQRGAA